MARQQKQNQDLFPTKDENSSRLIPILPNMYQQTAFPDSKTRSIDLARRIITELADSEARTKDGDICVGKDEILKITNKRRLYDVTGPLESMKLIQTTKINIIWTGNRLGSYSFVPPGARNANATGKYHEELIKFGRRNDIQLPKPIKPVDVSIPKPPKRKGNNNELKDKLRYLIKRRNLLMGELREKESQLFSKRPLQISYQDICLGVQIYIQQLQQQQLQQMQMQVDGYGKSTLDLQQTIPNLFIVSGEHKYSIYESQKCNIRSNVDKPKMQDKVVFEFVSSTGKDLEIHYIDNNSLATISPNMGQVMLRANDTLFTSPNFGRMSGVGINPYLETPPILNELRYGDGWNED